ncbi:MAG: D-ornithine 4,5-aminomutase subunit OraE [Clostridiaceae bacterium]
MNLKKNEKLDIEEILKDLEHYRPRRHGWHWREKVENLSMGPFVYKEMSKPLKQSESLPSAKYFGGIDPQPRTVITTEIASGRFEDDIRRMRMAAWHGADHIMVIRTAGQSHYDGLVEGTPQGIGGIPITRKQVRAQRKALDLIEDEVGREINFHSYVSGIAGPEIAVMFAEEGVNGAHQDPQYNILYRNINMVRSFVDAGYAKAIMAMTDMAQIDGAHNANATAREAWKVLPELMVQHAINSVFSVKAGMKKENICLSTVPPTAPPAPSLSLDLPYAVALREFFSEYRMRAQENTKYMESDVREATVTHVLNLLVSELTGADIQSTITPDEGRNVPWNYNNIAAISTAKQAFQGMDGLMEMIELRKDGILREKVLEVKERAVLFLEEIISSGGYFKAVEQGFFVDSGYYPERHGDGIARKIDGGLGEGTVFKKDADYMAPVSGFFGSNFIPEGVNTPSEIIHGDTFEKPEKIVYIDELDAEDNVNLRLLENRKYFSKEHIMPEVEWAGDGIVLQTMMLPVDSIMADAAALEIGKRLGLIDVVVVHKLVLQEAEGTLVEIKGRLPFEINAKDLVIKPKPEVLTDEEIREEIQKHPMKIIAGTLGSDEHSVGLREIIDIKHGGIEKYGIESINLGTSVPVEKIIDAAIESNADAILASTIISHDNVHYKNLKKLCDTAEEKGVRDKLIILGGGTQVISDLAIRYGVDMGFGRGTKGVDVATFLVKKRREMREKEKEKQGISF